MNLPSPLHVFLHHAAFQLWEEWYPTGRLIFADYVEEALGDEERAGKIRLLTVLCFQDWWQVSTHPETLPESAWNKEEMAQREYRRRVLALFPEVEFEVTQQVLECAPYFASADTLAPRAVQLLLANNSTLIKPIDKVRLICTKEGRIAAATFKIIAPDLLPPEDGPSPLRGAHDAFATQEAIDRARLMFPLA